MITSAPFYLAEQPMLIDEDVEQFQKRLDTMMINFRSETLGEFMRTKKQVLHEQANCIETEKRRSNAMLSVKQNEIETLKESLGNKSKEADELRLRCEILAIWAGKSKTLTKLRVRQMKAFSALKTYLHWKKYKKMVSNSPH